MFLLATLVNAIFATSVMTLYSYIWSAVTSTQTREPELLNFLLRKDIESLETHGGWVIHYTIGWLFTLVFFISWDLQLLYPTWINGILMGLLAGLMGCVGWFFMFRFIRKPKIKQVNFYFQLLIAHMLFGMSTFIMYDMCV